MGTGPRHTYDGKKRCYKAKVPDKGRQIAAIYDHLRAILSGTDRCNVYTTQVARFNKEVHKAVKASVAAGDTVDLAAITPQVLAIRRKFGYFLNPPANGVNTAVLRNVALALFDYLQRSEAYLDAPTSTKTLSTFTAFMAQRMARGYEINGTVVIPQVPLFTRHTPHEILYSRIPGVACHNVSAFGREFRRACLTTEGVVRFPMILQASALPFKV
jgi:hypothetical protein